MASTFLDRLPVELRSEIYNKVLYFDRIAIRPRDPCTGNPQLVMYPAKFPFLPINMSIIRTCKQVFQECRGVMWKLNTLVLTEEFLSTPEFINTLYTPMWARLRRIELTFSLSPAEIETVLWALQPLDALSRRGSLEEISFVTKNVGNMTFFGSVVNISQRVIPIIRNGMLPIFELLDKASNPKTGYLLHLKRSFHIHLGMDLASATVRKKWLQEHTPDQCENTLANMHHFLNGDVYVEGLLCYRDGLQIRRSFDNWDENGELLTGQKRIEPADNIED